LSLNAAASLTLFEFLYTALMPGSKEGFDAVLVNFSTVWGARMKVRTGFHDVGYVETNGDSKQFTRMKLHLSLALGILGWRCPLCGALGSPSVYCVHCDKGVVHAKALLTQATPAPATPVSTQDVIAWLAKQVPTVVIPAGTRISKADYLRAKTALQGVRPPGKVSTVTPLVPTEDACLRHLENAQHLLTSTTRVAYDAERLAGAPAACDAN
jgi:hypothetical protein